MESRETSFRSAFRAIRESLAGVQHDYTKGSLPRAITLLAIPMVLEMVMESLFALCDIIFVSQLGAHAVATVALTESMLTILYAVALGLSMSATALVARRVGEKNPVGAAAAGAQAIYVGLAIAVVVGIPGWLFAPELLAMMDAEQAVIEEGSTYTSILLGCNAVILLLFIHNAVFRGAGDAVLAMRSLWIANGINLVLDPCLIFGLGPFPEMGLTGAAVATTCGRGIGVAYQFWALRSGRGRIHLRGDAFRIDPAAMLNLLRISAGGIGQFLIVTSSWVFLMKITAQFGSAALAGYGIAIRILMFTLLPAWGMSSAAATLVGQSLGAGLPDRAERAAWLTGKYVMVFVSAVMVACLAAGSTMIELINDDPEVVRIGAESLRIITYGYVFYGWGMVLTQAFNGAGDTATPTWMNFYCFWVLQIPLAFFLAQRLELGPAGVFWSVAVAESVLAVVAIVWFRRGHWKEKQV